MNDRSPCDQCGIEYGIGDSPFCRDKHGRSTRVVVGDDIPGGMVCENGFESPQTFYSHSAHRKALAERGLEIRAKWAGEHDKIMTRWDTVDLESAAALVSRGTMTKTDRRRELAQLTADYPVTVTAVTR